MQSKKRKHQTIGEVIERLIFIKDNYGIKDLDDLQAINNACNILDCKFNRFGTTDVSQDITTITWQKEDIMSALIENGFEPNDNNVDIIISHPSLVKFLQEKGVEAGWDVIRNVISELKTSLLVLQSDRKE